MANQKISARTVLTGTGLISTPAVRAGSTTDYRIVDNLSATTDPGVGDDTVDGYHVGSRWFNASARRSWMCSDASTGAAVWDLVGVANEPRGPMDPDFNDSSIYLGPFVSNTNSGVLTGNRIYMVPIIVPRRRTFSTYAINVTALSGSTIVRLGLYNCNSSFQPTTKLDEAAATVDTSTGTGAVAVVTKAFGANQDLKPGAYFIAAVSDGGPSVTRYNTANNPIAGVRFSGTSVSMNTGRYRDAGASTLPADESAQTYTNAAAGGSVQFPFLGIR